MATTVPTVPATHADMLQSDIAMLATIGASGVPQVTAIWFLADEDGLVKLSLNTARQKVKNLQRTPECTLFFLDRANPRRTLEIRARAEVVPDPDYVFGDKLGKKYGTDVRTRDKPGERRVMVILHPVRIVATDLSRPH
ncbi:MAG: PPOX class F420-dependent oxidoreductase [Chloroflexota bacterium]